MWGGVGVWGLGFGVWGLGFGVWGLGCTVLPLHSLHEPRVWEADLLHQPLCEVLHRPELRLPISGSRVGVMALGLRV